MEIGGFVILAIMSFLNIIVTAMVYLMHADLAHSIEDIKHLTMLHASEGKIDQEALSKFFHQGVVQEGTVRFHIPSSLLNKGDDE